MRHLVRAQLNHDEFSLTSHPFTVRYQLTLHPISLMTWNPERETKRTWVVLAQSPSLVEDVITGEGRTKFSPSDFGDILANLATTNRAMDKWMSVLNSAGQKDPKITLEGVLIVDRKLLYDREKGTRLISFAVKGTSSLVEWFYLLLLLSLGTTFWRRPIDIWHCLKWSCWTGHQLKSDSEIFKGAQRGAPRRG